MSEIIVKLTDSRIKLKGGEYVRDLVRCKDCKYAPSYNIYGSLYCLKHNDVAIDENDFCSYGERAEE